MSDKNAKQPPPLSTRMIEDERRERQKKRDRERGFITIDASKKTKYAETKDKAK
ncbi:MAG: hypothetical protein MSG64_20870 [Pyrinomonadaceae bacterium MAG19_C2-C3]|nr:hypothetical protein [Pyrinomonadaceae bacterium MAG19_C2-C3]